MKMFSRVALTALAVLAVGALASAADTRVAYGKVKAVSDKVVTLADANGVLSTFEVAQGAKVYATGASRKSRMLASSGKKTTMGDFVRQDQYVTVYYREQHGTRTITQLRVL
jgi:hypothetical protein